MSQFVIETSIEIRAPIERVWGILTSFESFPQWSRFILRIKGKARKGERLAVTLDDGGGPMQFRPAVVVCEECVELRRRGSVGASFLFSGEHCFHLAPAAEGGTRLTHSERFRGILVPLFRKNLNTRTRQAFHDFNAALRQCSEAVM
jgi:hypothetical protein